MTLRVLAFAAFSTATVAAPLTAQGLWRRSHPPTWSLLLVGGGAYSLSDLEIIPSTDQNGGWSWDAGLRLASGHKSMSAGFERTRFNVGFDGAAITSGVFVEPRFAFGDRGIRPYVFAHGARILDYDVGNFCCSIQSASGKGDGWSFGGGFGLMSAPVGYVRFDLSASVSKLSGESDRQDTIDSWKSAGPVVAVRLGASVPLVGAP
jgi:hypothetical protein